MYAITAGHCTRGTKGAGSWFIRGSGGTALLVGFRPFEGYFGAEGDFGLIGLNENSPFLRSISNSVYVTGDAQEYKGRRTQQDPTYDIKRVRRSKVGFVLCYAGQFAETTCGKVTSLGRQMRGRLGDQGFLKPFGCKLPIGGDSGAAVFKKHAAFGILSGHVKPRSVCRMVYSSARGAEARLRVKIRTAG